MLTATQSPTYACFLISYNANFMHCNISFAVKIFSSSPRFSFLMYLTSYWAKMLSSEDCLKFRLAVTRISQPSCLFIVLCIFFNTSPAELMAIRFPLYSSSVSKSMCVFPDFLAISISAPKYNSMSYTNRIEVVLPLFGLPLITIIFIGNYLQFIFIYIISIPIYVLLIHLFGSTWNIYIWRTLK